MIDFGAAQLQELLFMKRAIWQHSRLSPMASELMNDLPVLWTDPKQGSCEQACEICGDVLGEVETKVEKQTYKFNQEEIG